MRNSRDGIVCINSIAITSLYWGQNESDGVTGREKMSTAKLKDRLQQEHKRMLQDPEVQKMQAHLRW